jgi:SAM-dependent methyltransferase
MLDMNETEIGKAYDLIVRSYNDSRSKLKSGKYLQYFLKLIPKNSCILDLGCGAGAPIDDVIIKSGHSVIGIDISSEQIKLAKKNCQRGQYTVGNIMDLKEKEYQVNGIVSFYTLFHVPRTKHLNILKIWGSFLGKNGLLLVSMGDREFEGAHQMHGETMWSSQWGTLKNRKLVEDAGFMIIKDEIDNSGGERHQFILAKKL